VHFLQTLNIHLSGTFLIWHRYFTWAFENKLRTECGYTGRMPYWEWGLDVNSPRNSPVFDGSDTSLGGDGQAIAHAGLILTEPNDPNALIPLPPGTGGGCVKTGPFKDMVVHVGPVALAAYGGGFNSSADPLGDNARCLKRDLNPGVAQRFTTFGNTTRLILQNRNVEMFQAILQADPRYVHGELGVHGGGHFIIGGDPGGDPFISPGDPAFYLHHSQVDRVYWIWQMLDFPNRQVRHALVFSSYLTHESGIVDVFLLRVQTVFGTETFLNLPPSPNVTLDTVIDLSPVAPPVPIRDLMNTIGGSPLCYIYL
jgi:tyrosinase